MSTTVMNWPIVLAFLGLAIVLVYFVLPRLIKDYSIEKGVKLILIYLVLGYLAYDFFKKEKFLFVGIFVLGAILYTYLILIAKRKS